MARKKILESEKKSLNVAQLSLTHTLLHLMRRKYTNFVKLGSLLCGQVGRSRPDGSMSLMVIWFFWRPMLWSHELTLITALLPLTPDIVSIGLALWSTGRCAVGRRAVHYVAAISFCFNVNNNGNSVRTRHVLKCCQYRLLVTDVNVGVSMRWTYDLIQFIDLNSYGNLE